MIFPEYKIPDNFVRLDTNINSADSFADVRDLLTLRKNHNKLLAERCKHTLLTFMSPSIGHETWPGATKYPYGSSPYFGDVLCSVPIKISDCTKKCLFSIYAGEGTTGTVIFYPVIHKFGTSPQFSTDQKITVSGVSSTLYQDYVQVPEMTPAERDMCMFTVVAHGGFSADSGKAGQTVLAVGPNWVDAIFAFAAEDVTYFSTNYNIEPNMCTAVYNIGDPYGAGTTYKAYHQYNWSSSPTTSDTVKQYNAKSANAYSYTLIEFVATDFNAEYVSGAL